MRERGSAMLIAVVSVTVLMLISGIFFSLVNDKIKSNSYEEKAIKSYYLAQAGVFYGIAKIKANPGLFPELTVSNPFGYGGEIIVLCQEYLSGYKITGIGTYGSGTGKVERILQAYYVTSSGSTGGTSGEIISQSLLNAGDVGQGNTSFVFCNTNPLNVALPVNLNQPIYIFTISNSGQTISGNSIASNVRLSLRNSLNQTVQMTTSLSLDTTQTGNYFYIVPNFQSVTGTPISISYDGNETVHLVVEGFITRSGQTPGASDETATITNDFVVSPGTGLIWQVEQ